MFSAASLLEFPIKFGDKEEELTVCLGIAIALIEPQAVVKLRLSIFRSDIFRYFVVFNILIVLLRKSKRQESENIQIYSGLSRQRSFAPRNLRVPLIFWTFWTNTNSSKTFRRGVASAFLKISQKRFVSAKPRVFILGRD